MRRCLVPLLACTALGAETPRWKASVGVQASSATLFRAFPEPAQVRFEIPLFRPRPKASDRTPGAVVEVWGDASWARQDAFKAFSRANLPAFRSAFDVGLSASVGADHLANLMGGDPSSRPPLIWSPVWFNATDPWARDRRFYR